MGKEVKSSEVFRLLASDGKKVKVRWAATGRTEEVYVKVINPGCFEFRTNPEELGSRVYSEDVGNLFELLETA